MIYLTFTYDVVTPESAEHGATSDNGFYESGGSRYSLGNVGGQSYERPTWKKPGDLRAAIREALNLGIHESSGSMWFYSVDPDRDFRTGEDTTYTFCPTGVTPATYRRIHRALNRLPVLGGRT